MHVVYGIVGLKTHAKVTLVVRREGRHPALPATSARATTTPAPRTLYEDMGMLSADADLGADLTELFNMLTGYSRQHRYRKLLVAPTSLRADLSS